jgi:hypothetical protein
MRICVIEQGIFTGDDLQIGCEYDCTPAEDGTNRQNNAWHALLAEYWRSGCHSYNAKNFLHFRGLIKLHLGAGTERFYSLVDDVGRAVEIPIIKHRVKSWKRYNKKERKESIDRLIAEMHQVGVDSKKFYEILEGMEDKQAERERINL